MFDRQSDAVRRHLALPRMLRRAWGSLHTTGDARSWSSVDAPS